MKLQVLPADEVFAALATSPDGLTGAEAARRLVEYGPNEIRETARRPLLSRLGAQFVHFLALLLWAAAILCFISDYLRPGGGMSRLGLAIIAVIIVNALFTFIQEWRAEHAIEELRKLLPSDVTVRRDGARQEISAAGIVPGDVVILREGDKVPADGRIIASERLTVNNAPLTGESDARMLVDTPCDKELLESDNMVFAGTLVIGGSGAVAMYATGMATEFGKIAHMTGGVTVERTPLQDEIARTSRIVASIAVVSAALFFALGTVFGNGFWDNLLFAVGVLAAFTPEGLLPTVTLSLAIAGQRMARRNVLVKSLAAVETLGSVDIICTDKTGTLTQNRMTVRQVWSGDESTACTVARLCNDAIVAGDGTVRGEPTDVALLTYAMRRVSPDAERAGTIPFDTDRKRMTTLHRIDGAPWVLVKGAFESLRPLCTRIITDGTERPLDDAGLIAIDTVLRRMMSDGLRVIALAFRRLDGPLPDGIPESDLVFAGLMGIEDPPRPEVASAMRSCRDAGIRVIMVTGDAGMTAAAIGREIGMVRGIPTVVEGPQVVMATDHELRELLRKDDLILARMTPRLKTHVVSLLIEDGHRVAVTGDGVNDAPALRKAHVGIAMGLSGTSVAREAADIVLLDDNFASIVNAVEEGRAVFDNIRSFITYIFASNLAEFIPFIASVLFRIPAPLTVMQILAIDLGTDMFPALALGAERPGRDVMRRPPRPKDDRLINRGILLRGYLLLGLTEAAAGMAAYGWVLIQGGWTAGMPLATGDALYMAATSACLAGIVAVQFANAFVCRSSTESLWSLGILTNPLVVFGNIIEVAIAMLIIYTAAGNAIFATTPVGWQVWLLLVPFMVALVLADELRKSLIGR